MSGADGEFLLVVGHNRRGQPRYVPTGTTDGARSARPLEPNAYEDFPLSKSGQLNVGKTTAAVLDLKASLLSGEVGKAAIDAVSQAWQERAKGTEGAEESGSVSFQIVCLGLGSPTASHTSRVQLALLLAITSQFKANVKAVDVYDPIFTTEDANVLRGLGCRVQDSNNEGRLDIDGPTLMYMPHAPRRLYANLLRANWTAARLGDMVIIGNSFANYVLHAIGKDAVRATDAMRRISDATRQSLLPRFPPEPNAFGDTAVMWFPPLLLCRLAVWCQAPSDPPPDAETIPAAPVAHSDPANPAGTIMPSASAARKPKKKTRVRNKH
eukprot:TRINITY_DN20890_c0_g1_i1.p1 TRINITY_DN20890_c0_g1~~TRINITY_DN20890_c0_g1_i1.p1  ORF type:complete len:325 (+),score=54.71 TRINITY_DN20890_c0_g1_i1:90-1064(+)